MPDISRITLPSGNTYEIKDIVARDAIKSLNNYDYLLCTSAEDTPIGVEWEKDGETIVGTLVASADTMYVIHLVPDDNGSGDIFDEYITTYDEETTAYTWMQFGNTEAHLSNLGDMAYTDTGEVTIQPKGTNADSAVTFTGAQSDTVLGEDTTFTNSSSEVTFGNHTTSTVLTSNVTATVPKTSSTTKHLTASASGTEVGVATSAAAITNLGTPSTDTFVKSYPGTTSKLVTTSVIGVGSSTTTASKATAGTAVNVATTDTAKTVATGSLGAETSTRGANTPMWGATVTNETLSFTFKPMSTDSVTPAKANGTITPYTFSDVTVPIKNSSSTTVATGSLASTGGGDTVMTGLGTATTASAVTEYGAPSSDTFAKTVAVTSQPSVTLTSGDSSSSGSVSYVSAVGTSGTDAVNFDTSTSGHTADAITALGTATAAAQTITVGNNDKVVAVTDIGTGTAEGQAFTGTTETYAVYPTEE